MRFLLRILLIAGLGFLGLQFYDYWILVVVAFAVGLLMSQRRKRRMFGKNPPAARAFLAGFLAIALLWGIWVFMIDGANAHTLSPKIFQLLTSMAEAPSYSSWAMISLTALLGGLLGGLGAMTGNLLGEAVRG
ncbi:MAG: hypothetical protein AAFR61_10325 [Bacteroidota bacterium]